MSPKGLITCLLILPSCMTLCSGSAIPIWELLTRNEKMSHLYSNFARLVSDYCKANADARSGPVTQCKRDMLTFGYQKLQSFSDFELDTLDPYQRGANELIWSNIMRGHSSVNAPTPTRRPSSAAPTPPASSILILNGGNSGINYQKNPLFDDLDKNADLSTGAGYGYALPASPATETLYNREPSHTTYLSGPHEVRVRLDGSPVEEDKHKQPPRDEDLEAYRIARKHKLTAIRNQLRMRRQYKIAKRSYNSQRRNEPSRY